MSVLWSKIRRDIFQNWSRSLTVILTITFGVLSLGLVINLYIILTTQMTNRLQASNPSHIHVQIPPNAEQAGIYQLNDLPNVVAVEYVTMASIHWKKPGDADWSTGLLVARESYTEQWMDFVSLDSGGWPDIREAGVERITAQYFGLGLGQYIMIWRGETSKKTIELTGVIHSVQTVSPRIGGQATFYVTDSTLESLAGISQPNLVNIQLSSFDSAVADDVVKRVNRRLNALSPAEIVDPTKGQYQGQVQALSVVLGILGIGILWLSTLLIINVFNAIMLQQIRQIGSMKTIGANVGQIMRVYLAISLIYGMTSTLLAIPLAMIASQGLSAWLLSLLNIDPPGLQIIPLAWMIQSVAGLGVPVLAALFPVLDGARITIHQAIQNYGIHFTFGRGQLEKVLLSLQGIPVSWAMSVRNILRRRHRSLLTLGMLVISGLLFISVMSVKGSFQSTLHEMASVFHYDVVISFANPEDASEIRELATTIPAVAHTEMHWTGESIFNFGGNKERTLVLRALPSDTEIYIPKIVAGRWLLPGDTQSIVLNAQIAVDEGVQVGDFITMTSLNQPTRWQVVGLAFDLTNRQRTAFVPLSVFAKLNGEMGHATDLLVQTTDHSDITQKQVEKALSSLYEKHDLLIAGTEMANQSVAQYLSQFDLLTYLLIAMSVLAAVVGGLGLMGAMFINVAERMREIGVMRAIGGDSRNISQIFIGEGMALGVLSWLVAAVFSLPASWAFARAVGSALFGIPLNQSLSLEGIGIWLVMVVGLSALASAWPARQAVRSSVRDSLSYE